MNSFSERLEILDYIRTGLDQESKEGSQSDTPYQGWLTAEVDLALSPSVAMKSQKDGKALVNVCRRLASQEIFNK